MKARYVTALCSLALCLGLLLASCAPGNVAGPKQSAVSSAASAAPASLSLPPLSPLPPLSSSSPSASGTSPSASAKPSSTPKPSNAPVEAVWTMFVDQTIPKTADGMKINYRVMLVAQKSGGKDVNGTYKGAAYVGINFDASQMNNAAMSILGGFNVNASTYALTFDVVGYDQETYSAYGLKDGEPPLAPLVTYQSMALLTPQMQGTGSLGVNVTGAQGEHANTDQSAAGSTAIPMRITIDSGKVSVSVPSFQLTDSFKGTVTGTPVGGGSPDNTIAQASEQIKAVMDQAAKAAATAPGGTPDLGSMLGQFIPKP